MRMREKSGARFHTGAARAISCRCAAGAKSDVAWRRRQSAQRALDDEPPNIGGIFATAAHQYQSQFDRQVGFTLC
jgi:hypothetical protein